MSIAQPQFLTLSERSELNAVLNVHKVSVTNDMKLLNIDPGTFLKSSAYNEEKKLTNLISNYKAT